MKTILILLASTILLSTSVLAATVDTRLSTRQANVGVPLTLQISLSNVSDYEAPATPKIDGCDVRSAGAPTQSTQITIINGRRSEHHHVTLQYLITPRREGLFTIPAMEMQVDGEAVTTEPQRFVATLGETGGALFVAIEGRQEKIYVGQPIDLKLKIWIKPFHDPRTGHTLSEGDMWNLVSQWTSWGGFETRMKELAQRRQRPGGREVLRDDEAGRERAYYLYEIESTVYPKRAGQIDVDDVQIVVNYPTEIGPARSPLGGLFDEDIFGNSPLSQMMKDDVFGSNFGRRLTITASRQIVGQASAEAIDVLPVPSAGRPSDYRGAVGRYQIVTQATPINVDAGDPITFNIGIVGSGAMELVQAPPLAELPELTADFKVTDESLAGFVQDDSKVFSTTIRPRQPGITEIPAIPFSFFNPETEAFETATSKPISITVRKSDMLALDSIVGPADGTADDSSGPAQIVPPDFTNHSDAGVLTSSSPAPPPGPGVWWWFGILPPSTWLVVAAAKHYRSLASRIPSLRPAKKQCLVDIQRAGEATAVCDAVATYILRQLPSRPSNRQAVGIRSAERAADGADRTTLAIAGLRTAGLYDLAGETETWLASAERGSAQLDSVAGRYTAEGRALADVHALKATATSLIDKLEAALAGRKQGHFPTARPSGASGRRSQLSGMPHTPLTIWALVGTMAAAQVGLAGSAVAQVSSTALKSGLVQPAGQPVALTQGQQEILLHEADSAYAQGRQAAQSDVAGAKEAFSSAAEKYQLLVASGVSNHQLFTNLGNAYLQSGRLGKAIANYEKASRLAPRNPQIRKNLAFAQAQIVPGRAHSPQATSQPAGAAQLRSAVSAWGMPVLGLTWVVCWGLLILRLLCARLAPRRYIVGGWLAVLLAGGAVWWSHSAVALPKSTAVVVAGNITLRAADGEQFEVVATLDHAEGHTVERLNSRGAWTQVRTAAGQVGWLRSRDVEVIS